MASVALRSEESAGLVVAVVLHLALVAALLLQPFRPEIAPMPERMTVSLAEEVGPVAMAPDPVAESRAAIAPTLADEPAPALAEPDPVIEPLAPPQTRRAPARRPAATTERRRPDRPQSRAPAVTNRGGGSRIGSDFLPGSGESTTTEETRIPASQIGPSAQASIVQAIARQIKPHWNAPSGLDADQLVTILAFNLNEDGSLSGRPRVVNQAGINDSNRPQASLHAERAIRAVQLAAPFDLPPEYYNAWKSIRGARFDRNLSR